MVLVFVVGRLGKSSNHMRIITWLYSSWNVIDYGQSHNKNRNLLVMTGALSPDSQSYSNKVFYTWCHGSIRGWKV